MSGPPPNNSFVFAKGFPHHPEIQSKLPDPKDFTLQNYVICGFPTTDVRSDWFSHAEHRCLVDWFRANYEDQCAGVRASAFDPLEVKEALGSIVVLEPTDDYEAYRYRLYGSRVVNTYGADLTGRTSEQLNTPSTKNVRPQYQAAARNNFVVYTEHDLKRKHGRSVVERWDRWSRLIIPLVGDDSAVSRVLVSMVPTRIPFVTGQE